MIDDMHMPTFDDANTQQPHAFLKFIIEKGFYYNIMLLEERHVLDTSYLGAMQPPGGGRLPPDSRFISLFSIFNITFPSDENVKHIYKNIMEKHFETFSEDIKESMEKVVDTTLKLHKQIIDQLPRTPIKFHYIFNLRDLSRVFEGVFQA